MKKISEKKAPLQVSFDITSNCNLRCVHCFNDSGKKAPLQDLGKEEKLSIARQVAAMHPLNTCICGGEATLCPYLLEIVDILAREGSKVSMVSNGFLMTRELAKKLREHGVCMVQISIDGAYAWQHDTFRGVNGSYERAVQAARFLREAGMEQLDVSLVPNRLNYRTMPAYLAMCAELGVNEVRMMPLLPSGRAKSLARGLMLDSAQYFYFQRELVRLEAQYQGRVKIMWGDPLDHMIRMPNNARLGASTYVMEIKTNGDLAVTSYLPLVAGNTRRASLAEYWQAGYNHIWGDKRFTSYTEQIQTIYDLDDFEPAPYSGEKIIMDLMEGKK